MTTTSDDDEQAALLPTSKPSPSPSSPATSSTTWDPRTWSRSSILIASLVAFSLLFLVLGVALFDLHSRMFDFLVYVRANRSLGAIAFVALMLGAHVLLVPGSLMWLAAGYAFGLGWGFAVAYVGSLAGLALAFLCGRYLFYDWLHEELSQRAEWRVTHQVIEERGWRLVLILRLAFFPYNVGNYLFATTHISFVDYWTASALGIIPKVFFFTWLGSLVRDVRDLASGGGAENRTTTITIAVVASIVITTVVVVIGYEARKRLRAEMARVEREQGGHIQ